MPPSWLAQEPIIGKFPYSGKAERQQAGRCVAYLFAMHVSELLPEWPEANQRKREWVSEPRRGVSCQRA